MITGCLQQKNGFYYAVLYLKVDGRRRCKWIPMKLSVQDTSQRKAQKAFDEIRLQYEREEEERLEREAKTNRYALGDAEAPRTGDGISRKTGLEAMGQPLS